MKAEKQIFRNHLEKFVKGDLLASVVVFLVALPLCMGIAIASGVPVAQGLITGIVGGLVVGMVSGCPLQVSGPAAGLTVIVYDIVQRHGLETLGVVVLLAGVIQLAAGALGLGQWFRAVSPAVVKGMLAGIGILILASQFHVMVDDEPKGSGLQNLVSIPQAIWKGLSIGDFESRSVRKIRAQALREVGELHRRHIALTERIKSSVDERTEDRPQYGISGETPTKSRDTTTAPPAPAQTGASGDVARAQQSIARRLRDVREMLRQSEQQATNRERAEEILQTAEQAFRENLAASEALQHALPAAALQAQRQATQSLESLLGRLKNHGIAAYVGMLTIAVIVGWQGFVPKKLRMIPGPLVAAVAATSLAALLTLPVFYVEVPTNLLDEVRLPDLTVFGSVQWTALLQMSLVLAAVASAETLLCATAVDQLHAGKRTRYDKELAAQGLGNTVCGLLGALPMTGVIVRSSANVHAGGQSRLSAVIHGLWLLIFVVGLAWVLRTIPTACLAAILVYTGYKLVDIKSARKLWQYGRGEVAIYAVTVVTIVVADLLTGVMLGIGLAAARLLYTFSHLKARLRLQPEQNSAVLKLEGAATFLRLPRLASKLEQVPPNVELHVDIEQLDYVDHACLDLLMTWAKQHEATGGKLAIDWDSLHAHFTREPRRKSVLKSSRVA